MKKALISVSDKTNLVPFAQALWKLSNSMGPKCLTLMTTNWNTQKKSELT